MRTMTKAVALCLILQLLLRKVSAETIISYDETTTTFECSICITTSLTWRVETTPMSDMFLSTSFLSDNSVGTQRSLASHTATLTGVDPDPNNILIANFTSTLIIAADPSLNNIIIQCNGAAVSTQSAETTFRFPDCPAGALGPVVNTDLNERCRVERFNSSVEIPGGVACYNGTATLSRAEYFCNCPSYLVVGDTARVCQTDGTWNGTVPQCLPQCDNIPDPPDRLYRFLVLVDCSPDTPNVTATYGCSLNKNNSVIQFNTAGEVCQWPDPPCKEVGVVSRLGAAAAGCYGSIMINICILVIGLLFWYKPNKIFIPFVLLVAVILPPVGLIWAWWLVREKVPAVSPANKDKSCLRKWWRAIVVIVGSILWLTCFSIWIALATIFAPSDALPSRGDYIFLIVGFTLMAITMLYWIAAVIFLCRCGQPRRCKQGEVACSKQEEAAMEL